MYKRKLHKEISSGLLALIVAFSLTGCGSSRDALEISDTESAQAEGISQEIQTDNNMVMLRSGLGQCCPGTAGRRIWGAVIFL